MRTAVRVVGLCVVIAFWGWYVAGNWRALAEHPWQLAGWPIALATALWCCYYGVMAAGWVLTVRGAGAKLPAGAGMAIWVSSMPARYVPGNVWHVAGRLYLGAQAGLSPEEVFVSSAVEQVLTVAAELVGFFLLLPLWPNLPALGLLGPLVAVPLGMCALHPRLLDVLLRHASRLLKRPLVVTPLPYRQVLLLLLWYVVAAAINGLAFFVVAASLGALKDATFPLLAGSYLLARALGFLSLITPAGIGVREALLVALLAPYLSLPLATISGLLARLISTAAEGLTVLAINGLVVVRRRRSRLSPEARL